MEQPLDQRSAMLGRPEVALFCNGDTGRKAQEDAAHGERYKVLITNPVGERQGSVNIIENSNRHFFE